MKKIKLIALFSMLCLLCISCGGNKNNGTNVYVCDGSYSTKYHVDDDCKGLRNCKGEIVEITEDEAIEGGRKPCRICCKEIIKSIEEAIIEINEQPILPEYMYMIGFTIHSHPQCPALKHSGLRRLEVSTTDFTEYHYVFCGECVGDELYKRLIQKDSNKNKE